MRDVSGALMLIRSILRKLAVRLRGSYTRALEEEVARLRAENRALVNSILGAAGISPIRVLEVGGLKLEAGRATAITSDTRKQQDSNASALQKIALRPRATAGPPIAANAGASIRPDRRESKVRDEREGSPNSGSISPHNSAPLRKRSWQQIGRALEMEDALAARRERESDRDAFPAPGNIVIRNS